jgi:Family of unknown function (DUF6445)
MRPWLFVVDDFLREPDVVRAKALELTYAVGGHYPGLNSIEKIKLEGLGQLISNIVQEPLCAPWTPDFSHQSCRLSLASDDRPGRVHIDVSHWTGVLSLTRDEDCRGGTQFFRHRRTGTDYAPLTPAALADAGYKSFAELDADILQKDSLDPAKWEQTLCVPLKFNRLILLQPHYWHTAGPGFGDSVENGRLVYLMFFKRVRPSPTHAAPPLTANA